MIRILFITFITMSRGVVANHAWHGMVTVLGTYHGRHALVREAGLTWRRNVASLIVTDGPYESSIEAPAGQNASGLERWFQFPNDVNLVHGGRGSDTKCVAALRIANATFPDASWFMYGDDDTQWFPGNAAGAVRGLNPNIPYILTDSRDCFHACTFDPPTNAPPTS